MKILTIEQLKKRAYPGSKLKIEKELGAKDGYQSYIASYLSDDLKIYGYLTIPTGEKPKAGWPAILFNHGYIPLDRFQTQRQYVRYLEYLARAGFVVFKPDFRGHGRSQGKPSSNFESGYAIDALNGLESLKNLPEVDKTKIGVWGHSMGGDITLKVLLARPEIKAAVIWAANFLPYSQSIKRWLANPRPDMSKKELDRRQKMMQSLVKQLGDPDQNLAEYQAISPITFINELTMPIQLHHGLADERIAATGSEKFKKTLENLGKIVELYLYPKGNHNLSGSELKVAMKRSVKFFKKYLK